MKWFDRWFARKCQYVWDRQNDVVESVAVSEDPHDLNDGLRIDLKRVIGGSIVTFRHYDRKRDEGYQKTYIITDEQEFEKELGKIITLESMRQ